MFKYPASEKCQVSQTTAISVSENEKEKHRCVFTKLKWEENEVVGQKAQVSKVRSISSPVEPIDRYWKTY